MKPPLGHQSWTLFSKARRPAGSDLLLAGNGVAAAPTGVPLAVRLPTEMR